MSRAPDASKQPDITSLTSIDPDDDTKENDLVCELRKEIQDLKAEVIKLKMKGALQGTESELHRVPITVSRDVKNAITKCKVSRLQRLIQANTTSVNDKLLIGIGEIFGDKQNDKEQSVSLLEYAALNGQYEICSLLLNLGANPAENDLVNKAYNAGYIHIAVLLQTSMIRGAAGGEAKDILQRLNRQNGIMKEFLSTLSKGSIVEYRQKSVFRESTDAPIDHSTTNCPGNHGLKVNRADADFWCDLCKKRLNVGDDVCSCRECNFDICLSCYLGGNKSIKSFIDIIKNNVIDCIQNEVGFSDDFMNLLYFYYTTIEKKPFVETDLFTAINKKCREIINNKTTKNWYFFKEYIMTSTIWMRDGKPMKYDNAKKEEETEEKEDGDCLFYELLKIVNDGFEEKIKAKLQEPFKKIAEENPDDWKALCSFDVESTLEDRCRQDLVPGGVKPDYSHHELTQYVPSSAKFNAYQHYDINEYLSKLLLTAHTVNKEFYKSIKTMFKINKYTNISDIKELNGMEYQKGPVKLIARCKAKAETDYANEPFPSSACILDMNRCQLIFEDISSMLAALNLMKNKISYYQSGNIVAICRDKNGFKEYNHDKPDYADIKFNVLIKGVKYNVIGEVQFMLRAMMDFKHSVHSLYSVIRRKEFVDDFVKIIPFRTVPQIELKRAAAMADYNAICDLLVTHGMDPKNILCGDDSYLSLRNDPDCDVFDSLTKNPTIFHSIFKNLSVRKKQDAAMRCFELILNYAKQTDNKDLMKSTLVNYDAISWALGHTEMMNFLFSEFPSILEELQSCDLFDVCVPILISHPNIESFINLTDFLKVPQNTIEEWVKNPKVLIRCLTSRRVENVKYILSLLPDKTDRMKLLNGPIDDDDDAETVLNSICCMGHVIEVLLQALSVEERIELICNNHIIFLCLDYGKMDDAKSVIRSIDKMPKKQLQILTQKWEKDQTLLEFTATDEKYTEFGIWVQHKIQILQSQ